MTVEDMVLLPEQARKDARLTELSVLESLESGPLELESLRARFVEALERHQARRAVYNRYCPSLDAYIDDEVHYRMLALDSEGRIALTDKGRERLAYLLGR